jgi:pantoate--beta-alanine ligase
MMLSFNTIKELKEEIQKLRETGAKIGFVPTMGALHNGHGSLVKKAKEENDVVICSIFVNPTQFNDKNDLAKYPRTIEEDKRLLIENNCDILFIPSVEEMYPAPDSRIFDFGNLDKVMEGEHRPGHFNGVAQVVSKFFEIIQPDKAYFGQKDFQQLAIIKALVKQLKFAVSIIPCPIVREKDGLAMSSRNRLLAPEERENAPYIYQTLLKAKELAKTKPVEHVKEFVKNEIDKNSLMQLEYFEIISSESLQSVQNDRQEERTACIAVKMSNIRLIDNISF